VLVNDLLVSNFPTILDTAFTAKMEGELDEVEEGTKNWVDTLKEFYVPFEKILAEAKIKMRDVKRQEILTDIKCEKDGAPLVVKFGRNGEFLACQNYPDCKNTKEFKKDEDGKIVIVVINRETGEKCDKCGAPMIIKVGRFGKFMACSKYPECKNAKSIPLGVPCPKCGGALTERRSKTGKTFFGCTTYPKCDFASWSRPVNEPCPDCSSPYLIEKLSKAKGVEIVCPVKECGYQKP
jgi:DNA topoisomerase I